jgi:hypothetical protein
MHPTLNNTKQRKGWLVLLRYCHLQWDDQKTVLPIHNENGNRETVVYSSAQLSFSYLGSIPS